LLQGTGGSAAAPWRIVERNFSMHYTMTGYISTKLLLIGIIKNYNRGSFNLAVISFLPASINIVSLVSQYAWNAKRGNYNCAGALFRRRRRPHFRELADHRVH
jgi:hypothetical protein